VTWIGILKALVLAVAGVASWLRDRQLIEAGRAEAIGSSLKLVLNEIAAADNARASVRTDLERNPERLRDDDGFKRSD
jgi:hypothetical protein